MTYFSKSSLIRNTYQLMNWYRFGHYLVDYGSYTFISKLMTWILITYISWGSVTDSNYLASTFIFFVRKLIGLIWKTWIWHDWTTLKTAKMSAVSIWKKLNSDFFHVTDFLPPCNISKIIVRPVFYLFYFLLQRLSSISNWTFYIWWLN